jgi:WD40 repeat protein
VKAWDANPPWALKATLGTGDDRSPLVDRVLALAFSPDGSLLATGGGVASRSGELKLWSVATGQLFRDLPDAHSDTVFSLSFSADGQLLASGGADKFARVWRIPSGSLYRSFEGHTNHVLDVGLRADGRMLVTGSADNLVKLWSVETGDQRATIPQRTGQEVTSVGYVGLTDRFVMTTGDGQVRLAREDFNNEGNYDVPGPDNFLYAGATSTDGQLILSGGHASVLHVRSRDGKVVGDLGPPDAPQKKN